MPRGKSRVVAIGILTRDLLQLCVNPKQESYEVRFAREKQRYEISIAQEAKREMDLMTHVDFSSGFVDYGLRRNATGWVEPRLRHIVSKPVWAGLRRQPEGTKEFRAPVRTLGSLRIWECSAEVAVLSGSARLRSSRSILGSIAHRTLPATAVCLHRLSLERTAESRLAGRCTLWMADRSFVLELPSAGSRRVWMRRLRSLAEATRPRRLSPAAEL